MNITELGKQAAVTVAEMIAEGKAIDFESQFEDGKTTIKEMIGTDDGAAEFVEKITYDFATGREAVPLVYKSIYRTKSDPNFPLVLTEKTLGNVEVVFLEKFEGGEVKFGTIGVGAEKSVRFHTWATGVEYDEDIVEYNQTWRVSEIGTAFGEAYNKLLNHLHMSPIIAGSYVTTGGGLVAQKAKQEHKTTPAAQLIAFDTDLAKTLQNALTVLPRGRTLLVNSLDIPVLENAIAGAMLPDNNPNFVKRTLSPSDFLVYEGDEVTVGGKTYTYSGVTAGFAYLVVPKGDFIEYIKHDLRVDSGDGDLSRLILAQVVGRARRAVLASLASKNGAVKVDIVA